MVLALRSLPLEFQLALELFYWEELTAAEIGEALEIPEGTVRSRLRIGRERLREALAELEPSAAANLDARVRDVR